MTQLSERQKQVVQVLLNAKQPVTAKELANTHNVSVRTLRYDLNTIRDWLAQQSVTLMSKPHKGLWLDATQDDRQAVRRSIDVVQADGYLQPSARMIILVLALAQTNEFITLQQLQSRVDVSQTTLKNDIKKLRHYLPQEHLTLVAKNYYGFKITGSEARIRELMTTLLLAELKRKTLVTTIAQSLAKHRLPDGEVVLTSDRNLNHLFNTVLHFAVDLASGAEDLPETEPLIAMMIRLTIAISRQSINRPMNSYQQLRPEDVSKHFYGRLLAKSYAYFELPVLTDDYRYILSSVEAQPAGEQNMVVSVTHLIQAVSEETQIDFTNDSQLQENLYMHLTHSDSDNGVQSYNPFTEDIKAHYPELFVAIKHGVQQELVSGPVSDAFVSFIALHFMVSLQRHQQTNRTVRVAYVCATGLGITNLIQQRITAAISNIEIVGFAGLDNARDLIQKAHPDLVISIFPLNDLTVPVIEVQPLPTEADIDTIRTIVAKLLHQAPETLPQAPQPAQVQADLGAQVQQTVLKMFSVYSDLQAILPQPVAPKYADAFLLHVFLAVHRIMFEEQYQGNVVGDPPLLSHQIEVVFARYGLNINPAECHAIIEYLNLSNERKEDGAHVQ